MRAASFCWQFQAPCNVFFLPLVGRGEQLLAREKEVKGYV
jgi:hypothetical protein